MPRRAVAALSVFETPGVWPAIWCVVAAAIYGCVPETDQMKPIALMLVAALVYELATRRRLHWATHIAIAAVLVWAGRYGAAGRERAYVGATFAFWPAVIVPLAVLLYPSLGERPHWVRWLIAGFGGVAALLVSRTGALEPGYAPVFRSVLVWGSASVAATIALTSASAQRTASRS